MGDRVTFRNGVSLAGRGEIRIGSGTTINESCNITAMQSVTIGSGCMLAPRVTVLDVDHEFSDPDRPMVEQGYRVAPVIIGDDVWVGTGVVILRGTTIGSGAIIGANSVVTRDVLPLEIVGGVPGKRIGTREP